MVGRVIISQKIASTAPKAGEPKPNQVSTAVEFLAPRAREGRHRSETAGHFLRGRLVVTPPLRKGETVMNSWIEFDLTGSAGPPEQGAQLLDHRQRRQVVVLGTSNKELTFDLAQRQMRALLSLADKPGPVERSGRRDLFGIT